MIVMPSGRRSSDPMPVPSASGTAPSRAAMRGHHDRPEAQQAGLVDGLAGAHALLRSASRAKSIIMIAFFLTMPISRMMPISAITLRSMPADQQGQQAPPRRPKAAWTES